MPFLDANTVESDPEGSAFLRDVIGKPPAGDTGSWSTAPRPPVLQLPSAPQSAAAAALQLVVSATALVVFVTAIARSGEPFRSSTKPNGGVWGAFAP